MRSLTPPVLLRIQCCNIGNWFESSIGSLTMKRKRGKAKPRQNKSNAVVENEPDLSMSYPEADKTVQDDVCVEFDSAINTQTLQTDFSMRKQPLCFEKLVNEKSENNVSSLGNRTCQEESRLLHQDPRYNEEELSAALLVIKIIMKSDAAQPFNVPVDPDLLGIPDYYDIIDTPMDFGTIRKNLEDGVKYVNSEDVFRDVQLIWQNCSKYNKKGAYVLELMKRVKINFMKFWAEAKLYVEPVRMIKGYSHLQPPHSRRGKECKDGSGTNNSACQLHQMGPHQEQSGCPSLTNSQIHKAPGPPTNDRWQNKHAHGVAVGQDTDNSIHQEQRHQALLNNKQVITPPVESNTRHRNHGHNIGYSVGSDTDNSAHKLDNLVQHIQLQSQQFPIAHEYQPSNASRVGQRKLRQKYPVGPDNFIIPCQLQGPRSLSLEQSQHQSNRERNQPQQSCNQPYSLLSQPDTSSNRPQASVQQQNTSSNQSQPDSSSSQSQSPQQQPEVQNDITSTSKKGQSRTRGPTRCLKLWNRDGKRIYVTTDNSGQPVGDQASKLISFLGTVARDGFTAPLIYADWRAMPEANKEKMWQQVQSKFDIDPICKDWALKSLGRKWKDWKAKLKIAHYNTHATNEERIADRDERVPLDQWVALVSYWSSAEGEARSARNKANRAHYKYGNATGAKRSAHSQLQDNNMQQHDTSYNIQKNQEENFTEIMAQDKHSQVVTNGLDMSRSKSKGSMPTRAEALKMVSVANLEVREMKEKMSVMEQTCAQMATQMSTMMAMISSMQKSQDKQNSSVDVAGPSAFRGSPQQIGHDNDIAFRPISVADTPDASEDEMQRQTRSNKRSQMVQVPPLRNKIKRTRASRK
ncbi:uncharacterized protein LOC108204756 isoform X3 [Daucus carota subsp. sativus]|uniref:uncharacterized protein LOC108204756 isoform X3 n=2 Tax=Daucus carota subsp. sativus TaxID=79200 RepID=UPI003083AE9F